MMEDVKDEKITEWREIRSQLKQKVITTTSHVRMPPRLVGGVDLSFVVGDDDNACAAYVVLSLPDRKVVYERLKMVKLTAPYIAGYLAFREADHLAYLIEEQREKEPGKTPDVILVDGNGLLHAHCFGLACHLGVLVDLPTIGVAKNLLQIGDLVRDENHKNKIDHLERVGDSFELKVYDKVLGVALKNSRQASKPVFVSVGHKIDLDTSMAVVLACSDHRIPEPIRQADMRSREYLRKKYERFKKTGII